MKYTEVNGKKLSAITLGTVQFGMNYGISNDKGQPDISRCHEMLDYAFQNGITSLDTSRYYGTSENVIGTYFENNPCAAPFVTSKLKVNLPISASEKEVEASMYKTVEMSLETLKLKKLDCLLLHNADDMLQYGDIVPRTLEKFVTEGYTDLAGVSVYTSDEVQTALENDVYRAIQVPMNLFDQQLIHKGYINALKEKNTLIFVRSVFLQGLFFMNPYTLNDPLLDEYAKPYLLKLRSFCEKTGMTIAEFAISFIRDIEGVNSLVLGADTMEQISENLSYFDAPELSEEMREKVKTTFENVDLKKIMTVLSRPKK